MRSVLIEPIEAFSDNYIWLLHDGHTALVVDPGDAAPVIAALRSRQLQLAAILVTHHHGDHVGGLRDLLDRWPVPVHGPAREPIAGVSHRLNEGDEVAVYALDARFRVLDVPGHTAGHIAYYAERLPGRAAPALFCGDTLFSAGCGRLFEGTAAQMMQSLAKLAALPADTEVYCTHEYTLSNLAFAAAAEPVNAARDAYAAWCRGRRDALQPTLPSSIGREKAINPFLRCELRPVADAVTAHAGTALPTALDVFAAMRQWKNSFR
jgi:hydroxyacylglutathione hydrolase